MAALRTDEIPLKGIGGVGSAVSTIGAAPDIVAAYRLWSHWGL